MKGDTEMGVLMHISAAVFGLMMTSGTAEAAGDVANGAVVYAKRCEQCHGVTGAADGPARDFMLPRPRVFKANMSYAGPLGGGAFTRCGQIGQYRQGARSLPSVVGRCFVLCGS